MYLTMSKFPMNLENQNTENNISEKNSTEKCYMNLFIPYLGLLISEEDHEYHEIVENREKDTNSSLESNKNLWGIKLDILLIVITMFLLTVIEFVKRFKTLIKEDLMFFTIVEFFILVCWLIIVMYEKVVYFRQRFTNKNFQAKVIFFFEYGITTLLFSLLSLILILMLVLFSQYFIQSIINNERIMILGNGLSMMIFFSYLLHFPCKQVLILLKTKDRTKILKKELHYHYSALLVKDIKNRFQIELIVLIFIVSFVITKILFG